MLRELQRAHEHWPDHARMDPQSPSFSVSSLRSVLAHDQSPPSTDVNSVPADQASTQAFVPVDDGVRTGSVDILEPVASADTASFVSPRVDVCSSDESIARTQAQDPISITTPSASVQTIASTSGYDPSADYSEDRRRGNTLEEVESPSNLEEALRSEAYGWPRLVFPPLKKSGHIIIDACTREGPYSLPPPFFEMKMMV